MLVRDRSQQPRTGSIDCVASSQHTSKTVLPRPSSLSTRAADTGADHDRRVFSSLSCISLGKTYQPFTAAFWSRITGRAGRITPRKAPNGVRLDNQVPIYWSSATNRGAPEDVFRGALCCAMWVLALRGADYTQYWRYRRNE